MSLLAGFRGLGSDNNVVALDVGLPEGNQLGDPQTRAQQRPNHQPVTPSRTQQTRTVVLRYDRRLPLLDFELWNVQSNTEGLIEKTSSVLFLAKVALLLPLDLHYAK